MLRRKVSNIRRTVKGPWEKENQQAKHKKTIRFRVGCVYSLFFFLIVAADYDASWQPSHQSTLAYYPSLLLQCLCKGLEMV